MSRSALIVEEIPYPIDPAALHAQAPKRYPFLLQSAAINPVHGRYDIVFAGPEDELTADGGAFLPRLDQAWEQHRRNAAEVPAEFPFGGGWFVYLGYELAAQVEPSLVLPSSTGPCARAVRIRGACIQDHHAKRTWMVAEPGAGALLIDMRRDLTASVLLPAAPVWVAPSVTESDAQRYLDGVARALEYIRAGDVYQVNLSRDWRADLDREIPAVAVYRRLCRSNPAPFAGLAAFADQTVISSSPERLLRVQAGHAATRPIAGTRPRDTGERDQDLRKALTRSPKERAEHVMLIDLERNDLGRICRPGTVRVDEFMGTESYAHVHHIVSNVTGELRADVTPGQAIAAVFPGGTITGVPKVRCMQIIADLERESRGAYTGSMGYLTHSGNLDLNILIRTLVQRGNTVTWRAGAGIVADSKPERELQETRTKARGLLLALHGDG